MTDKKMARSKDLTGARFGHLTVLEKTDKTQDRYCVWRCKCDCGRIPKTTARRGNIAEDLTGRTFGYLTVLHRTENRGDRTCWLCQCDCGNEAEVTEGSLVQGKSLSCGCLKRENQKEIAGKLQRVGIGFKGKRYNLGTYKTFAEAVDVRLQAEQAIHGGL